MAFFGGTIGWHGDLGIVFLERAWRLPSGVGNSFLDVLHIVLHVLPFGCKLSITMYLLSFSFFQLYVSPL